MRRFHQSFLVCLLGCLSFGEVTQGVFAVNVQKGHKPPPHAYVAVQYRGHWYYIDDRDHASKATLALMFQLGRLDFARQLPDRRGPVLTLPVGR